MKGKSMAETIAIFIVVATIAIYGAWKYLSAENTDYKSFVEKMSVMENEVLLLRKEVKETSARVEDVELKADDSQAEVEKMQDHFSHLRKNQILLQDKLSRRSPVLKAQGPIQVEILQGKQVELKAPQGVLKKVRKQMEGLSK